MFLSCFTALNGGKAKRWSSGKDILNSWYASSDIRPLSFATSTLLVVSHDVGSSSSLLSSSDRGMIISWPWTSNLIWNKANRFYTSATCLAGSFGWGYFLTKIKFQRHILICVPEVMKEQVCGILPPFLMQKYIFNLLYLNRRKGHQPTSTSLNSSRAGNDWITSFLIFCRFSFLADFKIAKVVSCCCKNVAILYFFHFLLVFLLDSVNLNVQLLVVEAKRFIFYTGPVDFCIIHFVKRKSPF